MSSHFHIARALLIAAVALVSAEQAAGYSDTGLETGQLRDLVNTPICWTVEPVRSLDRCSFGNR